MIWAILLILPAYFANATPVLIGGEYPIDKLYGKKIFGSHKTILGLITAVSTGVLVAAILAFVYNADKRMYFLLGVASTIGAVTGDLVGSLLKRSLKLKEGTPHITDLFFYALFAVLFMYLVDPSVFNVIIAGELIVFSALLHRAVNIFAYYIKLKKVPW